ncbi:hypothetical protein V6N11_019167 [Hibiscus sabdariffa]|uniref:CCHC-type domain-containing protein n=1 Tax=Hibiscus sabdariffa TaxID=183260 RepID=A0ABR2R1M4_9ROSI
MEKEYKHVPKIPSPLIGGKISAAESTLNWQTENAIAQNKVLHRIDTKVTQMEIKIDKVETKVDSNTKIANELMVLLHKRLQQIEKQPTPPGVELFYHLEMKQKEIQTLKEQIRMLEAGQVPQPMNEEDLFQKQKKPTTYEIYQLIKRQEAEKKRERDKRGKDIQDDDPSPKISKALMVQKTNPLSSLLKDYEDQIMMTNQPKVKEEYPEDEPMEASASPTNQPPIPNTGAKYNFTIDDIPVSRSTQRLVVNCISRRSNAVSVQQDFSIIIRVLHTHFLGNQEDVKTLQRKEFFKRKCCSFERRDLEKHYNAMIKLFYALGAEQVGEIHQETFIALEELCDRKKTIKEYLTGTKELDKVCKTPGLTIKCKRHDSCHCKRRTFRGTKRSAQLPSFPKPSRRNGKWKYLRKKRRTGVKPTRCFICGKSGHFAKSCPKNKKGAKLIQHIQEQTGITIPEDDDVELVFSIEDYLSDQSVFAIQSLEEELEEVETDWSSEAIYMLQHRISTNSSTVPIPHVQAAVYLEKYGKPIPIIAFIDTGAVMSIMNPNVLPKNWWEPHIRYFTSASDQTF